MTTKSTVVEAFPDYLAMNADPVYVCLATEQCENPEFAQSGFVWICVFLGILLGS